MSIVETDCPCCGKRIKLHIMEPQSLPMDAQAMVAALVRGLNADAESWGAGCQDRAAGRFIEPEACRINMPNGDEVLRYREHKAQPE